MAESSSPPAAATRATQLHAVPQQMGRAQDLSVTEQTLLKGDPEVRM